MKMNYHNGLAPVGKFYLLIPSSAAAERIFSLLENSFSKKQTKALEDYLETSLCYNIAS